jgi:hypothetical protein
MHIHYLHTCTNSILAAQLPQTFPQRNTNPTRSA